MDGDPTSVKLTGVGSLSDVPQLREMVSQLFSDVTNTAFTCDNSNGPGHLVGILSFSSVEVCCCAALSSPAPSLSPSLVHHAPGCWWRS